MNQLDWSEPAIIAFVQQVLSKVPFISTTALTHQRHEHQLSISCLDFSRTHAVLAIRGFEATTNLKDIVNALYSVFDERRVILQVGQEGVPELYIYRGGGEEQEKLSQMLRVQESVEDHGVELPRKRQLAVKPQQEAESGAESVVLLPVKKTSSRTCSVPFAIVCVIGLVTSTLFWFFVPDALSKAKDWIRV